MLFFAEISRIVQNFLTYFENINIKLLSIFYKKFFFISGKLFVPFEPFIYKMFFLKKLNRYVLQTWKAH